MFAGGQRLVLLLWKIDHDVLLLLTPVFLVAAGWDGRRDVREWPLSLFALTIALAMLTASFDLSSSATLAHLVRNRIALEKPIPLWRS